MKIRDALSNLGQFWSIAIICSSVFCVGCAQLNNLLGNKSEADTDDSVKNMNIEDVIQNCRVSYKFKYCKIGAELGDAESQFNLALNYSSGIDVKQDYLKAAKWYQKSAEQGHTSAQYNLGLMYFKGQGIKQDYYEAFKWFKIVADHDQLPEAQNFVGVSYCNGYGVRQDYNEAFKWFMKAANPPKFFQKDVNALHNLGNMYYLGLGLRQDYSKAKEYYGLACDKGKQDSCDMYRKLN